MEYVDFTHLPSPAAALASPWMWVVRRGPDAGLAFGATPGWFGRQGGLSDLQVSRRHLPLAGVSAAGVRLGRGARPYRLGPWNWLRTWRGPAGRYLHGGERLRLGQTVVRLEKRPRRWPTLPRAATRRFNFLSLLMLAPGLLFIFFSPWSGPLRWIGAGVIALLLLVMLGAGAGRCLPPAALRLERWWLAAAVFPHGFSPARPDSSAPSSHTLRLWRRRRLFSRSIELQAGQCVALVGPGALARAQWWATQALVSGRAVLTPDCDPRWQIPGTWGAQNWDATAQGSGGATGGGLATVSPSAAQLAGQAPAAVKLRIMGPPAAGQPAGQAAVQATVQAAIQAGGHLGNQVGDYAGAPAGRCAPASPLPATALTNPPPATALTLVVCPDEAQVPPWCERLERCRRRDRALSERWWQALRWALAARPQTLQAAATRSYLPAQLRPWWRPLATSTAPAPLWAVPAPTATSPQDATANPHSGLPSQPGLQVHLGQQAGGADLVIDLVTDGPHALVAGTTGAGKSELLTTWILDLAHRYSPAELSLVLVDYKGGATFGALADLPHCCGVLSNLQPALARRAVLSLQAEMELRQREFAARGVRDFQEYLALPRPAEARLPRILVMVDEFRALAQQHPELMESLITLATQGRSLGLHLILATQNPSGVVGGQIMANMNLRLALRLASEADSLEVLGHAGAAHLENVPGRVIIQGETQTSGQVAWSGPGEEVGHIVQRLGRHWSRCGAPAHLLHRPWAPLLPTRVEVTPSLSASSPAPIQPNAFPPAPAGLQFCLQDRPQTKSHGWWSPPEGENLLVLGPGGSGRTQALRTLAALPTAGLPGAQEAVFSGPLYILSNTPQAFEPLVGDNYQARGGGLGAASDLWILDHLLELSQGQALRGARLILDDIGEILATWDQSGSGRAGAENLKSLLAGCRRQGASVYIAGDLAHGSAPWACAFSHRVVLKVREAFDLSLAGCTGATPGLAGQGLGQAPGRSGAAALLPLSHSGSGRAILESERQYSEVQLALIPPDLALAHWQQPSPERAGTQQPSAERPPTGAGSPAPRLSAIPTAYRLQGPALPADKLVLGWTGQAGQVEMLDPRQWWIIWDLDGAAQGARSWLEAEYARLGYRSCRSAAEPATGTALDFGRRAGTPSGNGGGKGGDKRVVWLEEGDLETLENQATLSDYAGEAVVLCLDLRAVYQLKSRLPHSFGRKAIRISALDKRTETWHLLNEALKTPMSDRYRNYNFPHSCVVLEHSGSPQFWVPPYPD